jgi:hypothetical protein
MNGWFQKTMASIASLVDVVTIHWYPDGPKLDRMMDQLVKPFVYGKEVWLTETGLRPCATLFGEIDQARLYQQVLEAFRVRRHWWTGLIFYDLYDEVTPDDCGSAITRPDWSNRPAFSVYQRFINANR